MGEMERIANNLNEKLEQERPNHWGWIPLQVLLGLTIILFNAPGFYRWVANKYIPYPFVQDLFLTLADIPDTLYASIGQRPEDFFYTVMYMCFMGLAVYMGILGILGFRKGKLQIFILAPLALLFGFCFVPLLLHGFELLLVIFYSIVRFSVWLSQYRDVILTSLAVIIGVSVLLGIVVVLLRRYRFVAVLGLSALGILIWMMIPYIDTIAQVLVATLGLSVFVGVLALLYTRFKIWGVVIFLVGTPLLWFARTYLWVLFRWLTIALLMLLGFIGLLFSYIGRFFRWLGRYFTWLADILSFILGLLVTFFISLFFVIIGIGAVSMVGNLLVDDIKAAWNSGTGLRGSMQGAFGVGLAFSLIFTVALADMNALAIVNTSWNTLVPSSMQFDIVLVFLNLIPNIWQTRIITGFQSAGIPLFDAILASFVISVAILGALRGLGNGSTYKDSFSVRFYSEEALWLIIGPPLAVLTAFALASAPSDES